MTVKQMIQEMYDAGMGAAGVPLEITASDVPGTTLVQAINKPISMVSVTTPSTLYTEEQLNTAVNAPNTYEQVLVSGMTMYKGVASKQYTCETAGEYLAIATVCNPYEYGGVSTGISAGNESSVIYSTGNNAAYHTSHYCSFAALKLDVGDIITLTCYSNDWGVGLCYVFKLTK